MSSIFPYINHIDDLLSHISNLPEIRIIEHPTGLKTICYMISNNDTFNTNFAKECRGITFDKNGYIANRTMHKFFNVNERESTQKDKLDFSKIVRRMHKLDGSMITPCYVGDKIILKSKKSFTSDVAILANKFIQDKPNYHAFFSFCLYYGCTPTFEYTSPKSRIVINYQEEKLTLLHIRDNDSGEYLSKQILQKWASYYHIPLVEECHETDWEYYENSILNDEGIEGYVFQFENGDMIKYKTQWYLNLHGSITFPTYRGIAELVLNETIDDIKSHATECKLDGLLSKINEIETKIKDDLVLIEDEVEQIANENKDLSRKDFAIKLKSHKLFGLIMECYLGNEVDYKGFYKKFRLKDTFSVEQIGE